MVTVKAINIKKSYGKTKAVKGVTLEVKDKELITLLGPSGCGKTTLLRIIAGLIQPDEGAVYFGDREVTYLPPYKRNIGFVFQRVTLFPHMNVYKNVAFGLKMRKYPKEEIDRRVKEVLKIVHMDGYENRMPNQLSGGQAQRVEIARVLATDPDVLLFDEPLSNLDAKLRDELKYEIRRIQKETGKTAIYVTHDQAEAFAISDRIYVMNDGQIEQIGTPTELYLNPKSPFVADFIGTTNFFKGKIMELTESNIKVKLDNGSIISLPLEATSKDYKVNDEVLVSTRPEDISVVEPSQDELLPIEGIEGIVERVTFMGYATRLTVDVEGTLIKVDIQGPERFKYLESKGKPLKLKFNRCSLIKVSYSY